ncbi:MAG: ImmA/IrrE family metallo-endopeptidase, partial [Anaerolineae bacterium]
MASGVRASSRYQCWPRLKFAVQRAHEVLLRLDPDGSMYGLFPVDMDAVGKILGLKYVPAEFVHQIAGGEPFPDALAAHYRGHTVVILPRNGPPGRIFFDAAHEAGHQALGHFDDYDISWLRENARRTEVARLTLAVLDREADTFATELLMPLAVVQSLNLSLDELQFYHCVSYTAAKRRLEDLRNPEWLEITQDTPEALLEHCRP